MVGGNTKAVLQQVQEPPLDWWQVGDRYPMYWDDVKTLTGWLDLISGDSQYTYGAKLGQATHIFICDYTDIDRNTEDKRLVIGDKIYDVLWIDNPMELNQHLEIYLRIVG